MSRTQSKKRQTRTHEFDVFCECDTCTSIFNRAAYHHDQRRRFERMMTPVTHRVLDDRYLDDLMVKLGVRGRTSCRYATGIHRYGGSGEGRDGLDI